MYTFELIVAACLNLRTENKLSTIGVHSSGIHQTHPFDFPIADSFHLTFISLLKTMLVKHHTDPFDLPLFTFFSMKFGLERRLL